jgi:predicted hydrocarbon binding protein
MSNALSSRPTLGQFSSIVCFKAVITGMEEALGEKATAIALIAAGRTRGKNLVQSVGLSNSTTDWVTIADKLNQAVGANGTHLTAIDKIVEDGGKIKVYCSETICSAGEPQGSSRMCTFTLGAVWGAVSEITGKKLRGTHTESVLRGGSNDVFEFSVLE